MREEQRRSQQKMFPYWLLFGTFAFGSIGTPSLSHRRNLGILLLLAAVAMTLMIGFRYDVGVDWRPYLRIFTEAQNYDLGDSLTRSDPGFYFLVWVVHQLGLEVWALNLLCASIFTIGLVRFARHEPNPWLTIAVTIPYLVIVVAMSGTRQATAIGFLLLSLTAYSAGRLPRAALWLLLAALMHASAILMLGVAAVSYTRNRLAGSLLLIATVLLVSVYLTSSFEMYVDRYSDPELQSEGTIFRVAMNLLPALLYLRWPQRFQPDPQQRTLWRNISLLALLSLPAMLVIPSSTALDRLSLYLTPLQAMVLGRLPSSIGRSLGEYRLLTVAILAYLALALFVFLNFSNHGHYWAPYRLYSLWG